MENEDVQHYITINITGDEYDEIGEYRDVIAVSGETNESTESINFQNYMKSAAESDTDDVECEEETTENAFEERFIKIHWTPKIHPKKGEILFKPRRISFDLSEDNDLESAKEIAKSTKKIAFEEKVIEIHGTQKVGPESSEVLHNTYNIKEKNIYLGQHCDAECAKEMAKCAKAFEERFTEDMGFENVQHYITIDVNGDEYVEKNQYHDIIAISDESNESTETIDFQNYLNLSAESDTDDVESAEEATESKLEESFIKIHWTPKIHPKIGERLFKPRRIKFDLSEDNDLESAKEIEERENTFEKKNIEIYGTFKVSPKKGQVLRNTYNLKERNFYLSKHRDAECAKEMAECAKGTAFEERFTEDMGFENVQHYITIDVNGDEFVDKNTYHDIMTVSDERIESNETIDFQYYLKSVTESNTDDVECARVNTNSASEVRFIKIHWT